MEAYTRPTAESTMDCLPPFIDAEKEVTNDSQYSMYWLSLKDGEAYPDDS